MRYLVILNEDAGKAAGAAPDELRQTFAGAGIIADVEVVTPDRMTDALRAAVITRPDAVIVGGGDGTVRCAAEAMAGTGIPLGVLPLGTFNHFAKDLKMPTDLGEAVAVLAAGAARDVDVGEVNGHLFINNCSLGAYAEAVRRRETLRSQHGLSKGWAMCRASFAEFRRLRRLRLRIAIHAEDERGINGGPASLRAMPDNAVRTPVVIVGNNRYSGHLFSQHLRPRLDEGRLWLYTVHARRHLAVVRMMLQSLFGQLDEADALAAQPAVEIVIESDSGPVPIAADGEVLKLSPPFRFRIRPRALRVLIPMTQSDEAGTRGDRSGRSLLAGDSGRAKHHLALIAGKQAPTNDPANNKRRSTNNPSSRPA